MADVRDAVLQALYEIEQGGGDPRLEELSAKGRRLAEGVLRHQVELDAVLDAASDRWRVARMPPVDRNLLRLGLYELRYEPNTPVGVIISEAVRLAKRYSTERSGAFVNGVLAELARSERDH